MKTVSFNINTTVIPEASPETPPSGSGGGGGSVVKKEIIDFFVDIEEIVVSLKQGETKEEHLAILNLKSQKIKININQNNLDELIRINEEEFEILPNKDKIVTFDFIAKQNQEPNVYLGKIVIESENTKKEIPVVVEIESPGALFDVIIEISDNSQYLSPGDKLVAKLTMYNLGEIKKADVTVNYYILDEAGTKILSEQETVAVETRQDILKEFKLPNNIEPGEYTIYVKIEYGGKVASSISGFSVIEVINKIDYNQIITYVSIIGTAIILIFIIYELRKLRKHMPRIRRLKRR